MTDGRSGDERELWLAFDRVTRAPGAPSPADAGSEEEAGARAYVEALGLLPYALEPAAPRPETRERILAEIGARGAERSGAVAPRRVERDVEEVTLAGRTLGAAADVSLRHRAAVPGAAAGPASRTVEGSSDPWPELAAAGRWPRPEERPRSTDGERAAGRVEGTRRDAPATRWLLPLAAMLALSLLGLGFLAGQLDERNAAIASLESRLQGLPVAELASLEEDLSTMKRRFNMVTAVARRAYPLEVVESPDPDAPLDGVVYVCGDHQRWYLNVQGLKPPPAGREYHLWFLTDRGAINGGVVEVRPDATSEKDAQSMPEGTHAFAITLEEAGPHREPEGMMVLLGEESVSL